MDEETWIPQLNLNVKPCSPKAREQILTVQAILNEAIVRGFIHPVPDGKGGYNFIREEIEKFAATLERIPPGSDQDPV